MLQARRRRQHCATKVKPGLSHGPVWPFTDRAARPKWFHGRRRGHRQRPSARRLPRRSTSGRPPPPGRNSGESIRNRCVPDADLGDAARGHERGNGLPRPHPDRQLPLELVAGAATPVAGSATFCLQPARRIQATGSMAAAVFAHGGGVVGWGRHATTNRDIDRCVGHHPGHGTSPPSRAARLFVLFGLLVALACGQML